jgi:hypothetical protein
MEDYKLFIENQSQKKVPCPPDCYIEVGGWISRMYSKKDNEPIFMGDYKVEDFKDMNIRKPVGEDLLETYNLWTAIKKNTRDEFNMIELGAGCGLWSMIGHHINKTITNKKFNCLAVECEPTHLSFLERNIKDNNSIGIEIIDGVVDDQDEKEMELDYDPKMAYSWYGQNINNRSDCPMVKSCKPYKLSTLLKNRDYWNTIHFDIQESELRVINEAWEDINKRVKFMHIGTHSTDIENYLYKKFKNDSRWEIHQFYKCGHYLNKTFNNTIFGGIEFVDGVLFVENKMLDWTNPKNKVILN